MCASEHVWVNGARSMPLFGGLRLNQRRCRRCRFVYRLYVHVCVPKGNANAIRRNTAYVDHAMGSSHGRRIAFVFEKLVLFGFLYLLLVLFFYSVCRDVYRAYVCRHAIAEQDQRLKANESQQVLCLNMSLKYNVS